MVLPRPALIGEGPLHLEERPTPMPGPNEVLVRATVCGVCRTDLHIVEGDLPPLRPRMVPGHEVVGRVERIGAEVRSVAEGETVGVPWLRWTCGQCEFCRTGRENLCETKELTGYSHPGGYAGYVLAREAYVLRVPSWDPAKLAPFLCAGIIGFRALKMAAPRPGGRIGFFGFGGSAHLNLQLASRLGYETVAYSRNSAHLELARKLGASETVQTGTGGAVTAPPHLDGAIVFAPVGAVVLDALRELKKGGTVAIAGIHVTPIPEIDYDRWLVGERKVVSVEANTRADAREFLDLATRLRIESEVEVRPLSEANAALRDLNAGTVQGAVVLDCSRAG